MAFIKDPWMLDEEAYTYISSDYVDAPKSFKINLPTNPYSDGEAFLYNLDYAIPQYIKEIVVTEAVYLQILGVLAIDTEKEENKEALKSLEYPINGGNILLKNAKYQFDLDKYMEYGPSEEK